MVDGIAEEEPMDVGSSSDEEDDQKAVRPYNELLQLLSTSTDSKGPARKKRKVDHGKTEAIEVARADPVAEDEEAVGGDDLQQQEPSDEEDNGNEEEEAEARDSDDEDGRNLDPTCCFAPLTSSRQ